MTPIPVKPCRAVSSHASIREAIDFANSHPLQSQAKKDSELLIGAELQEAFWSATEFVFRFSNGMNLHVYVHDEKVCWRVCEKSPAVKNRQTIGAEAVVFRWPGEIGDQPMDCSDMIQRRIGAQFQKIFVNELGLWAYMKGFLILHFSLVQRSDTSARIFYICESE